MKRSPHDFKATELRKLLTTQRKNKNLLQKDLAELLDRPQSFVSKYENGERKIELIDFVEISLALKINPEKLLQLYLNELKK